MEPFANKSFPLQVCRNQVIIHDIRALHQLVHTWPTDQISYLEQAWSHTHQQLQAKAHPWYIVKGPMAAAIAYLLEWQWQVQELFQWTRPETPYLDANTLNLGDPWWRLEQALLLEAKNQRTSRLASRPNHQHLLTALDWHTYRTVSKQLPARLNTVKPANPRHVQYVRSREWPHHLDV